MYKIQLFNVVPAQAPANVMVHRLNNTAISISWTPLNLTEARGIITGYSITYEPTRRQEKRSIQEQHTVMAGPDQQSYVIGNLEDGTTYCVSVAVVTEAGVGPVSDAVYEEGNPSHSLLCANIMYMMSIGSTGNTVTATSVTTTSVATSSVTVVSVTTPSATTPSVTTIDSGPVAAAPVIENTVVAISGYIVAGVAIMAVVIIITGAVILYKKHSGSGKVAHKADARLVNIDAHHSTCNSKASV